MGILLCGKKIRDVWRRNKSVRAEIGKILRTHTHAAKLVVRITRGVPCQHGFMRGCKQRSNDIYK